MVTAEKMPFQYDVTLPTEIQYGIDLGEVVFFRRLRESSPLGLIAWARVVEKANQKLASFRIAFRGRATSPLHGGLSDTTSTDIAFHLFPRAGRRFGPRLPPNACNSLPRT